MLRLPRLIRYRCRTRIVARNHVALPRSKQRSEVMSTLSDSERRGLAVSAVSTAVAEREAAPATALEGRGAGRAAGEHGGGFSLRNLRTFESFRVSAFRWFYGSMI